MAQFNFFNYGQAAQDAEAIKSARTRNRMAGLQADEAENIIKNRKRAKEVRQQMENMPAAIERLEAEGLFDEADKLRETYVTTQYNNARGIASMRDLLNEDNWKSFREGMIRSGAMEPDMLPVEYSDDWLRKRVEEEKGKLERLTRQWGGEQGVTFSQDFIQQDGEIIWEGKPYEDSADRTARGGGSGGWDGVTASDSNSIRNASASLYGGMWDPVTQRIVGLDKDAEKKVLAISSEAANIYNNNKGRIPHDEAVRRAARKMKIEIPELNQPEPDHQNQLNPQQQQGQGAQDPLGINNLLKVIPPHMQPRPR